MNKLFLTSSGLDNKKLQKIFLKEIQKTPRECGVLMAAYTQNEVEKNYVNNIKEEMISLGFRNILIANIEENIDTNNFGKFDVIYVCGGNTYTILDKMRKTEIDKIIISQVKNGAIYVGVSAGSIIAGKNIEIAGWGSEGDKNNVGLKDLSGFNFTNIAIFPHFKNELEQEVDEFKKKVDYPVIKLRDGEMAKIIDGKSEII